MIKAAIFDLDGTLLDSNGQWNLAPVRFLQDLGKQARPGLAEAMFTMTLPQAADYMREEYGVRMTPAEMMTGINGAMEKLYMTEVTVKPGVPELLRELHSRGVKMMVVSVTDRYLVEMALERFGLLELFADILSSDKTGLGKHSPEMFLMAAGMMDSSPEETFVFEDAPHALKAAGEAGFVTVGVYDAACDGRQDEVRALSDIYLADFSDLSRVYELAGGTEDKGI